MSIFLIHVLLGILLFYIINWIGKHSYSIGYVEISIFVKNEEAPALNFLIRVLTPVVFIIIASTFLYYLKLDSYVKNIYLVNVYYIIFRLIFNIATNRTMLLNWYRQFLYWVGIFAFSFFTYEKLIKVKANILPDFTTIANELWIIILIFLFQVANNVNTGNNLSLKRKENYIRNRYNIFKSLYGHEIKNIIANEKLEAIVYAVMIYEDFNRPKIFRIIENLKLKVTKKPHTLGIMQVKSEKVLTDKESVILGTNKILESYNNFLADNVNDEEGFHDSYIYSKIVSDYNGGSSYNQEVLDLIEIVLTNFYKESTDTLQPA